LVRVVLVRHGETGWNKAHRIQGGGSDTPLNATGQRQKELVARRLQSEKLQAVYASPLQRAVDTAQAIAAWHHLAVTVEPALREIDVGEYEGASVIEIGKHITEILTMGTGGETMPTMPGGESLHDVQARVWDGLQRLVQKHPEGTFAVVSHYFAILAVICKVLDMPVSQIGRFRMDPGTISTVVFDGAFTRLHSFNDSGHLTDI
jgi:broad specificity phosphatase PhoE